MAKGKLLDFIKKAGKAVPGVLNAVSMVSSGNILGAIEFVGTSLKGSSQDNEEAKSLLTEFEIRKDELALEAFRLESADRDSARGLYKEDNSLQKIVAYFSLAGFTLFLSASMWMSYQILQEGMVINEFVIMTVSNGNGLFTGLIFTLKDFLFGGSAKPEN